MSKNVLLEVEGQPHVYWMECPGCKRGHVLQAKGSNRPLEWDFNGDRERPTFTPSFKHTWKEGEGNNKCCHFIITDGIINYCNDCTHPLANQSVKMEPFGHDKPFGSV